MDVRLKSKNCAAFFKPPTTILSSPTASVVSKLDSFRDGFGTAPLKEP